MLKATIDDLVSDNFTFCLNDSSHQRCLSLPGVNLTMALEFRTLSKCMTAHIAFIRTLASLYGTYVLVEIRAILETFRAQHALMRARAVVYTSDVHVACVLPTETRPAQDARVRLRLAVHFGLMLAQITVLSEGGVALTARPALCDAGTPSRRYSESRLRLHCRRRFSASPVRRCGARRICIPPRSLGSSQRQSGQCEVNTQPRVGIRDYGGVLSRRATICVSDYDCSLCANHTIPL